MQEEETGSYPVDYPSDQRQPAFFGQHPDNVRLQLTYEDILEVIEHLLKGEELMVEDTHDPPEYWKQIRPPIISQDGYNQVMTALKARGHRGFILTSWDEDEVRRLRFQFEVILLDMFMEKAADFGIKKWQMDNIIGLLVDNFEALLKRAYANAERDFMSKITQRIERADTGGRRASNSPIGLIGKIWGR